MARGLSIDERTGRMIGVLVCDECGAEAACAAAAAEPVLVRDCFAAGLLPDGWRVEEREGFETFLAGPGAPRVCCPDCEAVWARTA